MSKDMFIKLDLSLTKETVDDLCAKMYDVVSDVGMHEGDFVCAFNGISEDDLNEDEFNKLEKFQDKMTTILETAEALHEELCTLSDMFDDME